MGAQKPQNGGAFASGKEWSFVGGNAGLQRGGSVGVGLAKQIGVRAAKFFGAVKEAFGRALESEMDHGVQRVPTVKILGWGHAGGQKKFESLDPSRGCGVIKGVAPEPVLAGVAADESKRGEVFEIFVFCREIGGHISVGILEGKRS